MELTVIVIIALPNTFIIIANKSPFPTAAFVVDVSFEQVGQVPASDVSDTGDDDVVYKYSAVTPCYNLSGR